MVTLQQQYPKFKTYKYRFTFADFQPNATRYGTFLVHTFARTVDIAFIKFWLTQTFAAPTLNTCTLRVHDSASLPITDNAQGEYTSINGLMIATNNTGVLQFQNKRTITTTTPPSTIIADMVTPTGIYVTINLNNPRIIDQLTAGGFDIWIGTIKNS